MLVLGVGVCYFLVKQNIPSLDVLRGEGGFRFWPHGLWALMLFFLHTVLVFFSWHYSLKLVGVSVSAWKSMTIFIGSSITRYIPGGFWHLGSRLVAMSRLGKSSSLVGVTLFLEQAAAVTICLILALVFLLSTSNNFSTLSIINNQLLGANKNLLVCSIVGLLFVLYPPVFRKLVFTVFRYLNRSIPKKSLPVGGLCWFYVLHVLSLVVYAMGYQQLLVLFDGGEAVSCLVVISGVLAATLLGFLAPFVPGGIGVRETLMVVLLSPSVAADSVTAMALAGRVSIIGVELVMFVVMTALVGRTFSGKQNN